MCNVFQWCIENSKQLLTPMDTVLMAINTVLKTTTLLLEWAKRKFS